MARATVKAYAKINLTLDVVGAEGGFHNLDSFVASIDLFDGVTVKTRKDKLVSVYMRGLDADAIPPFNSLAQKAAERFVETFQTTGADIVIDRNIPVGAGLGSSSASIAGVLCAMAKAYKIQDEQKLKAVADGLGSDAGYMLTGGYCRMTGRGTKLWPLKTGERQKLYLLLICPKSGVGAGECYREYDRLSQPCPPCTDACISAFLNGDLQGVGKNLSNHLYPAAKSLNKDVERALCEALDFSPLGATMTGSGSAVVALFETKELRDWAKSRYKGKFRTYAVETISPADRGGLFLPIFKTKR